MTSSLDKMIALRESMKFEIVGQEEIINRLLIGILCNGNLLVEGLPGLAKTRAIKALSNNIEGDFKRIQFTPDLQSTDITGREDFTKGEDGERIYEFIKGPIFSNIVLADEINRAPSRVQNSLLEAMEERQVTVAAVSHKMPQLFMVMATQNPVNQEGTFALPEAQMDRFLMHVSIDYPDEKAEAEIIRLVRSEEGKTDEEKQKDKEAAGKRRVLTLQEEIFTARQEVIDIHVPEHVERYIVNLIFSTRYPDRYSFELKSLIEVGASPRGSLALDRCSRACAWLKGKDHVEIEDVQQMIYPTLRHRLTKGERAIKHKVSPDEIIDDILELVPVPKEGEEDSGPIKPPTL